MLNTNMDQKIILVTGSTSGIGETITRQFAGMGARVVAVGRNREKLEALEQEFSGCVYPFEYDLCNLEDIENIFKYCKDNGFKLDGLVHSAGIVFNSALKANDIEEMEKTMRINCFSLFELGKYFSMKKYSNDGASLVAISSIASLKPGKGLSQYAASKAAVNSVVKTMSMEFMKRKLRVNAILPADVRTPMIMATINQVENFMEKSEARQPLGFIDPEQIGYMVEFLLSDNARYMTGELIVISGGMEY